MFCQKKIKTIFSLQCVLIMEQVCSASSRNGNSANGTVISVPTGWNGKSGVPSKVVCLVPENLTDGTAWRTFEGRRSLVPENLHRSAPSN